jgi:superfamily II DNA or RNA helicase
MHTPSEGQELAIEYATSKRYSIIAMPPGQGKTLCAVEVARRLKLNTLVVCPSYAKKVWVKEFKNQFGDQLQITLFNKGADIYPLWDDGVAIVSYSLLTEPRVKDPTKRMDSVFEWADLIVFDEGHLLKETDNKRTLAAHKLVYENQVPYVMLLSGTPAKNRVHELYSQIALCHYKNDYSEFLQKYPTWVYFANQFSEKSYKVIKTRRRNIPTVNYSGVKNKEELKEILDTCYFKLPDKYLHKLPERTIINVEPDITQDIPELMKEFEEFILEEKGVSPAIKAKAALASAKFTASLAIDLQMKHGSVVIFTDHVASASEIARSLKAKKMSVNEAISGELTVKRREKILEDFQEGATDFIVATVGTLSTAISLTRSQCMIINDPPWVSGDLEQTEKRILRRGQKNHCYYYRVMATKQAEKIYKVLDKKKKDLKQIDELMEDEKS